jgi:hypothetical protein
MIRRGHTLIGLGLVCTLMLLAGPLAAQEQPSGTVSLYATSVAVGVGVEWGRGTLTLANGQKYAFSIQGLEVAGLGYADVRAEGKVYNLQNVADFAGVYAAAEASAAAGSDGPGALTMRNQHGIVMHLSSVQDGLKLTLGGEGLRVALKE